MSKALVPTILCVLAIQLFSSCNRGGSEGKLTYPDYFPEPVYEFVYNEWTEQGFELGKDLFFDPLLSKDGSISCATCHDQSHAFADHNTALSFGVDNQMGSRNSPSIVNTIWQTSFMWDGGINHLEIMPIGPLENPVEMAEELRNVLDKLNEHPTYSERFASVFGTKTIADKQFFYALAQYQGALLSTNSLYDQFRKGSYAFTAQEESGYQLFQANCASCHTEPLFTDFSFKNTGLIPRGEETGRHHITLDEDDKHKFKVPSLRNIALTHPYMHDGRFRTLQQVLDHYSDGVIEAANLAPELESNGHLGIPLNTQEKEDIIAFLHTLSDWDFVSNPKFQQ